MPPLVLNLAKTAGKFFLFGAVASFTFPYIGAVAGLAPTPQGASAELGKMGDPLLVGLAFMAVGVFDAAIKPLSAKWFGGKKPTDTPPSTPGA